MAHQHQLQQCPGIGPKKVRALVAALQEPFFPEIDDRYTTAAAGAAAAGSLCITAGDAADKDKKIASADSSSRTPSGAAATATNIPNPRKQS